MLQSQVTNYFRPQHKLVAKVAKVANTATTPCHPAIGHDSTTAQEKAIHAATSAERTPAAIQRQIQALTAALLTVTLSKACAAVKPLTPAIAPRPSTDEPTRRLAFGYPRRYALRTLARRATALRLCAGGYHGELMTALITRPDSWGAAFRLVQERGYEHRERPFKLASGKYSHDYIDGKFAIDTGARLWSVSRAITDLAVANGVVFNTVGGLTMGADPLAHGVCIVAGAAWFSVRKEPKPRGREQWIEGTRLSDANRILLVDDVVSTGGSIMMAYHKAVGAGAHVVGVIPMVDRGDEAAALFERVDVPYLPLVTYSDLGIESVSGAV